jgi:fibronectin-binding autotransporter adhesin
MKRKVAWSLLTLVTLVGLFLTTQSASSSSSNQHIVPGAVPDISSLAPVFATTFDVDRMDDTAAATACTAAPNDCSLRGAIIAANGNVSANPVIINLQPATTYNLTLTNATQENAAATGDLDITTSLHTVTIAGGGSSGPSATIIDAAGLNTGNFRDRAFHITKSGVTVIFQNLVIQNGKAADDGTSGASTNPTAQNANRAGGGILNKGGSLTLHNVVVRSCQALGKGDSVINDHTTLDAQGGGLASLGATGNVIITDSKFTGNTAAGGTGGNFNNGAGSNAKGGSIYFEGGTLNINGSRIDTSAANGGNGGNQDQNGQTNGGFGGFAQGGGVWVGGGTVSISKTTFESTVAKGGNSGTGGNGAEPAGPADGGGLYSLGNVTVSNSTFHLAGATGGNGGNTFGTTCLGAHNAGDGGGARGGAIFADGGSLIVNSATFANNFAAGGNGGNGGQTNGGLNCGMHGVGGLAYGGALTNNNAATVNIKHGTISLNNAKAGNSGVNQGGANKPARPAAEGAGGGIRVGPANVTLENTIVAGNTAANGAGDIAGAPTPGPNVDGTIISNGHNLLGVATDAGGFGGTGDKIGANPMLAALANNGGPTQTMALSVGSAAIDAGVAAGATLDQRGLPRTVDQPGVPNAVTSDGTDIGAFESQSLCRLCCPNNISVPNDTGKRGAVVRYEDPSETGCGRVTCDHPSGSFFPVGETIVTCTSAAGPACSFKVTVTYTQAPK